ncbi:hypothetical protein Tco_0164755 [Tanacetum coccineum]|uniref:Uncharacterized protein n=1 Tax=Tanacetum coccineum TaxID=301880 RepID=A0ABQ5IGI3_9ASTR
MELHDVSYGIEYVARPLLLFFSSEINFLLGLLKWTYALYLLGLLVSAGMDTLDNTEYEPEDQELEVRYLYMEKIQEVTPDAAENYGPIFDVEPLQKQPESVNDTYPDEQGNTNITTDSLDMSNNGGEADQDDDDDLARERDLLASLIEKLKCEIDESKDRNKFLKKFQAELDRYHDVNYASKVEIECAKAKGELISYRMSSEKSFNEYT